MRRVRNDRDQRGCSYWYIVRDFPSCRNPVLYVGSGNHFLKWSRNFKVSAQRTREYIP